MIGGSTPVIDGGTGNDLIQLLSAAPGTFGYAFTASTRVQGGTGYDTLELQRAPVMTFTSTTMLGIEHLLLDNGYDYDFTTVNATVASGARLLVDGSALTTGNYLHFNGAAETNGAFDFLGGDAQDVFAGGALADTFTGGWSGDTLTGGAGSDTFIYNGADESLFIHRDHITDFDASADHLQLDVDVAGINNAVSGAASTVTDIVNLANGHLTADHAMLVDVTSGALTGSTLLLIDANGTNGFQAASDYCIDVTGMTGTLNAADFIL
jgi:Ca2+-binding RTX toxin-like protein